MNPRFKTNDIAYFVSCSTFFAGVIGVIEEREDGIYYSENSNINDDIFYKDVFRTELEALKFIKDNSCNE